LASQGAPLPPAVDDAARWLGPLGEHVRVLYNNSHFPRAWIVRDLVVTKRIDSADRTNLMPMLESLLFPYDRWIDFRTMAWVEEEEMLRYARNGRLALPASDVKEVCRVVRHDPQRVEIEAELATPGLVVLADLYYPGWELTAETGGRQQSLPIFRTDRILRGALLPAGKHRLIYEYRSWNFYVGAAVSAAAWLAALGVTVLLEVGRRRAVRIDSTR
jgi:hypothetical protein